MGANQTRTRKLTVENDDPTSVIKVSDDVVQRIKNSPDPQTTPQPQPSLEPSSVQLPNSQPTFIYEPNVTSVQLRHSNVAELKKNDHYWENRLKNLQASHQRINEILETEYKKAVEEMDLTDKTIAGAIKSVPCQDWKTAVIKCYQENPQQSMNCSCVVQAFQKCVDSKRISLTSHRG